MGYSVGVDISGTSAVSSAGVCGPRDEVTFVDLLTLSLIYWSASMFAYTLNVRIQLLIRLVLQQTPSCSQKGSTDERTDGENTN